MFCKEYESIWRLENGTIGVRVTTEERYGPLRDGRPSREPPFWQNYAKMAVINGA